MRAYCGGSRVSDQQPWEEALRMDPAFLEKREVSKTTMCAVRKDESCQEGRWGAKTW